MRVREVMTAPAVCVGPATTLKRIAEVFVEQDISAAPVVDDAGELIGIVSEQDLLHLQEAPDPRRHVSTIATGAEVPPRHARDVMTTDVVALHEDADVAEAARVMLRRRIKRIPIVSARKVIGIVSRRDVLRVLARDDEEIRRQLQDLLDDEIEVLGAWRAQVRDGAVVLVGDITDPTHRLAALVARSIPGVVSVTVSPAFALRR